MNIKKFLQKRKSPYRDDAPRVRNSYYTFSREYPAGNIPLQRRMHLRFKSKHTITGTAKVTETEAGEYPMGLAEDQFSYNDTNFENVTFNVD
ncbi:MAG: hypothetical protein IIX36_06820, partial [Clostridia bacterium]|nr:hypothetical protein [Clostridia bacterium]